MRLVRRLDAFGLDLLAVASHFGGEEHLDHGCAGLTRAGGGLVVRLLLPAVG